MRLLAVSLLFSPLFGMPRRRSSRRLLTDFDLLRSEFASAFENDFFTEVLRTNNPSVVQIIGDARRLILPRSLQPTCQTLLESSGPRLDRECVEAVAALVWEWRHSIEQEALTVDDESDDTVALKLFLAAAERQASVKAEFGSLVVWQKAKEELLAGGSSSERLLRELDLDAPKMNPGLVKFLKYTIERVSAVRRVRELKRSAEPEGSMHDAVLLAKLGECKLKWILLAAIELRDRMRFPSENRYKTVQEVLNLVPHIPQEKSNFPTSCFEYPLDSEEFLTTCAHELSSVRLMRFSAEEPSVTALRAIVYGLTQQHELLLRTAFASSWTDADWVLERIEEIGIEALISTLISPLHSIDPASLPPTCLRSSYIFTRCSSSLALFVSQSVNETIRSTAIRSALSRGIDPVVSVIAACLKIAPSLEYNFQRLNRLSEFQLEPLFPGIVTFADLLPRDADFFKKTAMFFDPAQAEDYTDDLREIFPQLAPALWELPELYFGHSLQTASEYALLGRLMAAGLQTPELVAGQMKIFSPALIQAVSQVHEPRDCPPWLRAVRAGFSAQLPEEGLIPPVRNSDEAFLAACRLAGRSCEEIRDDSVKRSSPAGVRRTRRHPQWQVVAGRTVKVSRGDEVEDLLEVFSDYEKRFERLGVQPKLLYSLPDETEDEDEIEENCDRDDTEDILRKVVSKLTSVAFGLMVREESTGTVDLIEMRQDALGFEYVKLLMRVLNLAAELVMPVPEVVDFSTALLRKLQTEFRDFFSVEITGIDHQELKRRLSLRRV